MSKWSLFHFHSKLFDYIHYKGYYRLFDNGNYDTLKSCTQCPTTANPTDVDNQERAGVRGGDLLIFFDVNPDLKIESTSVNNRLNF